MMQERESISVEKTKEETMEDVIQASETNDSLLRYVFTRDLRVVREQE
jgi:hypothetical protein